MTAHNSSNAHKVSKRAAMASLLVLTLMTATSAFAYDPNNPLGLSNGMNLVVFDNFVVPSSDVQGRIAVGGNANISAYSVNTNNGVTPLYTGTGLTVGGDLITSGSYFWGGTTVGGNLSIGAGTTFGGDLQVIGNVNGNNHWLSYGSLTYEGSASGIGNWQIPTPVQVAPGTIQLGIDFAAERARSTGLSQNFDALSNSGSVSTDWNTLSLNANHSNLAIFDLNSSDVLGNLRLDNLAANATVLINVHGQTVDFGSHSYENFAPGRVLFNLPEATQITFASSVNASFLAPLASFYSTGGLINGQVVVSNWTGSTQINDAAFNGNINISPVPEPATYAMMLAGLLALGAMSRKFRTTQIA